MVGVVGVVSGDERICESVSPVIDVLKTFWWEK